MRLFEALLLSVNFLTLVPRFRRGARAIRAAASVNVLALALHGIFDGFRYQLAFSYAFVLFGMVHAAALSHRQLAAIRAPAGARRAGGALAVLLLAASAFLGYALPRFELPPPSGPYAVGSFYMPLVDNSRSDPFLAHSAQKRAVMIKVLYPGEPDPSKPVSAYFRGSAKMVRAFAGFYQAPRFLFDHLRLVTAHSQSGLRVSRDRPAYPVVLFSNGAGTSMEVETSQSEDLASRGYIVVDIDHPYVSAATVFPNRIITASQATRDFDTPEPAAPITRIMADDAAFVLTEVGEMQAGRIPSPIKGRIAMDRAGVIGHSVGGAAAYGLALRDARVKAAINLDGAVYEVPSGSRRIAPFLMVANDAFHIQAIRSGGNLMKRYGQGTQDQKEVRDQFGSGRAYEARYAVSQRWMDGLRTILKGSGRLYTVRGSDHMKFTDIGLFIGCRWLRELLQIRGSTDPARCLRVTEALTAAFFDWRLKESGAAMASLRAYPELEEIHLR